jgi:feruloyl esterase
MVGGWADTAIAPASNTDYYEAVLKAVGRMRVERAVRLFMVPDMGHCPAAPTAMDGYMVDTASIIQEWQRTGKAPDTIVATHRTKGVGDRKLLVCRYPETAVYVGPGDPSDPSSFRCQTR